MAVYADYEEIRDFTRVGSAEFDDEALDDMIYSASSKIDRLTGRTWQGVKTITDRYYNGDGNNRLVLDHTDIGTLTALSINISATGTTFTTVTPARVRCFSDLGVLELQPNAEVTYFPVYTNSIKASYTYGNTTIPDDIKLACRYYVAYMMKVDSVINQDFYDIIKNYTAQTYRIV